MRAAAIRDNKLLLDLKEFLASSGDATFGFVDFIAEVGAPVLVLVEPGLPDTYQDGIKVLFGNICEINNSAPIMVLG